MDGRQLGRAHRRLRLRARLRQVDVSSKSGIGRWKLVKLEAGEIDDLNVGEIERCFVALGADVRILATFRGAAIDRLLDEGHARLVGAVVEVLKRFGWSVEVEVSFSDYGDRGSIDILAWQPTFRALAVFEIKSEMGGVDLTLRPLDVKVRLAPKIAQRFGWVRPLAIARLLVLPEDRTARRDVARHAGVLDTALPSRARAIRSWLRKPSGPLAGIWFLSYVGSADTKRNPSASRRVRRSYPRSPSVPTRREPEPEAA
jgi:hypothetical protein